MQLKTFFVETKDKVKISGVLYSDNNKKIIISTHGMQTNGIKKRDEIIAENVTKIGYDYLSFNNRGREVITMINKMVDGKIKRVKAGTAYEDVTECYYDIKAVINFCIKNGYTDIILQGHSLGSIKTVYTYNKLKQEKDEIIDYIKGIILLSMPDIPELVKFYLNERYENIIEYAINMKRQGKEEELMPDDVFLCPISVRNFLYYLKKDNEINFVQLSNTEYDFKEINNIDKKILIIYGNNEELILQDAKDVVNFMKEKTNKNAVIEYIDGANHMYRGKEEELAYRICKFLE